MQDLIKNQAPGFGQEFILEAWILPGSSPIDVLIALAHSKHKNQTLYFSSSSQFCHFPPGRVNPINGSSERDIIVKLSDLFSDRFWSLIVVLTGTLFVWDMTKVGSHISFCLRCAFW